MQRQQSWSSAALSVAGGIALVLLLLAGVGGSAPPARAEPRAELQVCASGCPYTTVQSAIDAAAPGDVVQIATGVYTGVIAQGGSSQIAYLTKTLTLRGGYNAAFTAWDPALYPTRLDAQNAGRVVRVNGAISVTLEGLQLANGYASNSGAGVYSVDATLRVLHCLIEDNRVNPTFNGNLGVGLHQSGGTLLMEDSTVQENQPNPGGDNSHDGGGLYAINATVAITASQFLSNTAAVNSNLCGTGGGMHLENSTSYLRGLTFRANSATSCNGGGGGLWDRNGSLHLFDSTFEGNTNGGASTYSPNTVISGNTFRANTGYGLYISGWSYPVANITVTANLVENNTGIGMLVGNRAVNMLVEDNDFTGNAGGLKLGAVSDTGAATTVRVLNNRFQNNSITGDGGGAHLTGAIDVIGNRFTGNTATGKGGGIYQMEYCSDPYSSYSCHDNASAVTADNVFRGNAAALGGGLYSIPKYSANLRIAYRNLVFRENTATTSGSALYFYRYTSTPVTFQHLTVANNTGGDGTMIYHMMGKAIYTNTILADGVIGIKRQNDTVTLDHVLRHNVITPTLNANTWGLTDRAPLTGAPAFAADGYHLTASSAAIDAGAATQVTTDIDGQPRPLGNGPDVGADESPYSANVNGVQVSKLASPPEWRVYYTGVGVPPSTYLQQEYLIPFAYYAPPTAPQVRSYTLQDRFPADLDLESTTNPAGLLFNQEGVTLTWTSQTPLLPGQWSWVGLTGRSGDIAGGASLLNTGSLSYTLANEVHGTLPFSATTVVPARPVFPPLFLTPGDGEICVNEGASLSATGLAGAGMLVRLYEDNTYKASATASATGQFTITWTSALTESHPLVFIYAESCEPGAGGACSGPSDVVRLEYPEGHWCPQRSYWEGEAQGIHHTFYFRNDLGRYATDDFALPGVYGFWNTQMHLYSCCAYNELNPFKVRADGQLYDEPVAHNGRMWTFNIGSAHEVTIETQCFGPGGEPGEPIVTHGEVLIDPDGFVFDVDAGGSYSPTTGIYAPVQALPGITVTAYVSVPEWGGWIPWPAHLYQNQINPQVTGANGYFAFFTPPGFYYLEAQGAGGYQSWRSPVVQVINEIVHVNIPLTRWQAEAAARVQLTPAGLSPATLTLPAGSTVEWVATLDASATGADLSRWTANPLLQPRTAGALDPLTNTLGFDGGKLAPGQVYRRQFSAPGTYAYTDGMGRNGTIVVTETERRVFLPLVLRER